MTTEKMGCCGAYCGTCKEKRKMICLGCKTGYSDGRRDLLKAKCKIKVCCIGRNFNSCSDCPDIDLCENLKKFFLKNGFKYKKYKEALEFIKNSGYDKFFEIAETWKAQYGKY